MIDSLKYLTDRVEITKAALQRTGIPEPWKRTRYDGDRPATNTITFKFVFDSYAPVKALVSLTQDGRPRLWKVEAVLPSLLHGHNGRPIRNRVELALAITRLRFLLGCLVCDGDNERLVPGLGHGNQSYLTYLEASVQVQDPNHDLLVSSHVARLCHQRFATAVFWGESTRMATRELSRPPEIGPEAKL